MEHSVAVGEIETKEKKSCIIQKDPRLLLQENIRDISTMSQRKS
jgi:hypothetical protein